MGRHPLVGLAAAFAGVAAAFGANFVVKPIGLILTDMTNDAIQLVDPARSIDPTANFYFGIVSSTALLLSFVVIGFLLSFPFPAILPKWAIMAPVFVPRFLRLGVEPDALLAAYRVSDAPPDVINPLLPHLALVVGFAQRWQRDADIGTIVAMRLPYTVATFVAWSVLFFAWFLLGVPFGP